LLGLFGTDRRQPPGSNELTNWDDYRYFASLVRTRSVRATADHLGVNPSTVTRRLDGLENRLGLKLFVRSHAGLRVTADGEELMRRIEPLAAQIGDMEQRLYGRAEEVAGTVRITVPDVFAILLMADFSDYARRHPRIQLEFLPGYQTLDLDRGEADVAIRVTDKPLETLVGRRLGRYRLAVYASRDYLSQQHPMAHPERCLWIEPGIESMALAGFKGRHFPAVPSGTRCNNVLLQHAAVAAHMGIGLLPCAIGDSDESLCRVGGFESPEPQEIWLLSHPDLRGVARIQSVSAFIHESFARLEPRLLGDQDHGPINN